MADSNPGEKRPAPRRMDTRTVTFANAFEYAAARHKLATPWIDARAAEADEGAGPAKKKRKDGAASATAPATSATADPEYEAARKRLHAAFLTNPTEETTYITLARLERDHGYPDRAARAEKDWEQAKADNMINQLRAKQVAAAAKAAGHTVAPPRQMLKRRAGGASPRRGGGTPSGRSAAAASPATERGGVTKEVQGCTPEVTAPKGPKPIVKAKEYLNVPPKGKIELFPAFFPDDEPPEEHSQTKPAGKECVWYPAEGPVRFAGGLYGPTGRPHMDDVHQGVLGDCYLAAGLIMVAGTHPAAIEDAITLIKDSADPKTPRTFHVTLKHFEHGSRHEAVTIEVNDLFYTQGLATNLGYSGTDKKKVKDITKEDFDDSACTDWGERRLTRMRYLADIRGINKTRHTVDDELGSEAKLLAAMKKGHKALYMNTGDRTPDGCIWPMLMEKAWIIYCLDHIDAPTTEPRSYRRADASVNMARTTVGLVCMAVGGWNGMARDVVVTPPTPSNDLNHEVHRYYSGKAPTVQGAAAQDVKIAREHLMLTDGTFETATLCWTNGTQGSRKPYRVPQLIGEADGDGFSAKDAETIIEHIKAGYPAALATGKRETDGMKLLGLHGCHCYPIMDWQGTNSKVDDESDYLTIRNPHNRIGIKNTAPNLQKALLCVDSFAYGRTAGWKMTANILNPDNVDEDGLKNLFERIDTDKSGAIDAIELGDALRTQGVSVTDAKVATLISVADSDHDGFINFEEFLVVMA